jgi:methylated-DNA-protein-cysteine methyltransferase-like protein
VCKNKEAESLRFLLATPVSLLHRKSAKLDKTNFIRVQFQPEPDKLFPKFNFPPREILPRFVIRIVISSMQQHMDKGLKNNSLYKQIYNLVCQIPPGKVATYGQIARIIDPCAARWVGYAMAALPFSTDVPWQRVINHRGEISRRAHGDDSFYQRQLLEAEGIQFDKRGRVDLKKVRWVGPECEWLADNGLDLPASKMKANKRVGEKYGYVKSPVSTGAFYRGEKRRRA